MCSTIIKDFMRNQKFGFFTKFSFKVVCVPKLKNQQPESTYLSGIILRKKTWSIFGPSLCVPLPLPFANSIKEWKFGKTLFPTAQRYVPSIGNIEKAEFSNVRADRVVFGTFLQFLIKCPTLKFWFFHVSMDKNK